MSQEPEQEDQNWEECEDTESSSVLIEEVSLLYLKWLQWCLLLTFFHLYLCVWMLCLYVCLFAMCLVPLEAKKRALDLLELELHVCLGG